MFATRRPFSRPHPGREIISEGVSVLQSRDREPGRKSNGAQSGGQWGLERVWHYFGQLSRFEGRILRRPAGIARNHPKFAGIACVNVKLGLVAGGIRSPTPKPARTTIWLRRNGRWRTAFTCTPPAPVRPTSRRPPAISTPTSCPTAPSRWSRQRRLSSSPRGFRFPAATCRLCSMPTARRLSSTTSQTTTSPSQSATPAAASPAVSSPL